MKAAQALICWNSVTAEPAIRGRVVRSSGCRWSVTGPSVTGAFGRDVCRRYLKTYRFQVRRNVQY